jgi:O-antigen ligase
MAQATVHPADLDPSQVAANTYVTRRRFTRIDAASLLSVMLVLLMVIPAPLIIPGATDVGRPALVLAMLLGLWWLLARLNPRLVLVGPQPLRWALLMFILSMLASYVVGLSRGLTTMEANSADRWMLVGLAFVGIILTAADGLPNWARFTGLIQVFVWCGAFMAIIGLIQVVTRVDVTTYLNVPGLQAKGWIPVFEERGGGIRVASTTGHYIEFSAVLATCLPFAIHLARFGPTKVRRRVAGFSAFFIAAAIPTTISRTAIVAAGVVVLIMMSVWTWRFRYNVIVLVSLLVIGAMAALEGLFDTFVSLFAGASEDKSVTSRTDRYQMVLDYFVQRPWFGRGTGTWVSPQYQYLDNQWFAFALTNGLFGVLALLGLHITAISLAVIAMRRSTREADRHVCAALISTQFVAIIVAFFYDSLSFYTYVGVLAVTTGLCGAVWRFTHPARTVRTSIVGSSSTADSSAQ